MAVSETHELIVIQLNINSIISMKKRTELEVFTKKHKPQIIILSETKLNKKHTLNINGYKTIRNDRTQNSGGGTAILYSNNIECEEIETPKNITTFECCIAKLTLKNSKPLIIASIYKPPTELKNKKQTLIKINTIELNKIFEINKNAYYLIGGDFNAKHTEWNNKTNCSNGKSIYAWYETHKYMYDISIYTSQNPTCMRSIEGNFIDFGFISNELNLTNNKNLKSELFSDHAAIFINIKITPKTIEHVQIKNYRQTNWGQMKTYIQNESAKLNIPTNRNINKHEIDTFTNKINEIYETATEKFIPNIKIPANTPTLSKKNP